MNWIVAVALCAVVGTSVCVAQDPRNSDFRCDWFQLVGEIDNQLGSCPDTITVQLYGVADIPLPEKHPTSPYSEPGKLFAYSLNAPNTGYTEFPAHWMIDRPKRTLYIIPDQRLLSRIPPSPTPNPVIVYTIQLECGYWTGDTTQKNTMNFNIRDRMAVSTWAMSLEDSTRITPLIEGFDSLQNHRFFIADGLEITAPQRSGDWVFSHWSPPTFITNVREFNQPDWQQNVISIKGGCWPNNPLTVPFAAWYRKEPVSASDPSSRFTIPAILGREHHLEIHVGPASAPVTQVQITDVRGRVVAHLMVSTPQPVTTIPCTLQPGVYFVQVWRGATVVGLPYYHHP